MFSCRFTSRRILSPAPHLSRLAGLVRADYVAFERGQSKTSFIAMLDERELPYPPTRLIRESAGLMAQTTFPCYMKTSYGTAGNGMAAANYI